MKLNKTNKHSGCYQVDLYLHIPEVETKEFMEAFDLVHSSLNQDGYKRVAVNGKFIYKDSNDKVIDSQSVLNRIKQLVLPPAWKDVWICKGQMGIYKPLVLMLREENNINIMQKGRKLEASPNITSFIILEVI